MIEKMNRAESRQREINIVHTPQRGSLSQRRPGTDTGEFPTAVAANQHPIMAPLYFGGATLDTNDMPIGESRSSAKVRTR